MPIVKDSKVGFRWQCLKCGKTSRQRFGTRFLTADDQVKHWASQECEESDE